MWSYLGSPLQRCNHLLAVSENYADKKNTINDNCETNRMKLPVRLQILYIHAKCSVKTKSKTSAKNVCFSCKRE